MAKRFLQTLRQLEGKDFSPNKNLPPAPRRSILWKVRYGIHRLNRRPDERLLFEHQRELAKLFGYVDNHKELAVEQFMHDYYRAVQVLRELNDVLLQYLDEVIHANKSPHITPHQYQFPTARSPYRGDTPAGIHPHPQRLDGNIFNYGPAQRHSRRAR